MMTTMKMTTMQTTIPLYQIKILLNISTFISQSATAKTKNIKGQIYATAYGGQPIPFLDEMYDVTSDEFEMWADIIEPEVCFLYLRVFTVYEDPFGISTAGNN